MVKIPRAAPATARSTDRRASLPPNYVADHRAAYVSEVNLDVVAALLVADRCRPIGSPALGRRRLLDVGVRFGSLATLEDVIDFYDAGGRPNPFLSPFIRPLYLADYEKAALVAFLRTLTDQQFEHLASEDSGSTWRRPDWRSKLRARRESRLQTHPN